MATLNITNPTFQEHVFVFRAPEQLHNQRHDIPSGLTVPVFYGSVDECKYIVDQHQSYGITPFSEALSRRNENARGLLYSIKNGEDEVDAEDLANIRKSNAELLDDLAAAEREKQAVAQAAANQREQRQETSLELSVTQEADANNREAKPIQTVQVTRNAEAPQSRRGFETTSRRR